MLCMLTVKAPMIEESVAIVGACGRKRVNSTVSAKSERSEGPVTRSMENTSAVAATEASKPGKQVLFKRIDESKFQDIKTHF